MSVLNWYYIVYKSQMVSFLSIPIQNRSYEVQDCFAEFCTEAKQYDTNHCRMCIPQSNPFLRKRKIYYTYRIRVFRECNSKKNIYIRL
ncbi:hypothetical protein KsCSTR_39220 [Candidatus Kuenenia stuttgartiensis]|uniref:Uncharacterized protein n=1 Tax=Kuenenia stuttgartiensis TaxID=174633 RepID=Q1PUL6_KUEST|nr:hypothetical protein KsCSTR_39220 [Candidatus Kuenenia stuttgartiensis]CAJ70924.1 unknown protein [Candidatus Kuenenia stuttgartiensis]